MASVSIELKPFPVPETVFAEKPSEERRSNTISYKLSELDEQTLSELCDSFRRQVFENAGKVDPRHPPIDSTTN
jgi:hypothetical protein